ncbi:GAF domain-containing protein [Patescibacteria group bacterium]|nr:GAF domain-containing protein [Patescibacteria group bacterium]
MDQITTLQPNVTINNKPGAAVEENIVSMEEYLQRVRIQQMAIKTLSEELTHVLDLGEAVDVVNKYLWEIIDYSAATYIIYNIQEGRFEARSYLKESVSSQFLTQVKKELVEYIQKHSEEAIVGSAASISDLVPLIFGVVTDEFSKNNINSSFITPLRVGGKIVGALMVTSTKEDLYSKEEIEFADMLVKIASISVARIHTFIQSLHSRTETLVKSISDGVVMFDQNYQVTFANEAMMKYTGLPDEGYKLEELSRLFDDIKLMGLVKKSLKENIYIKIPRTQISRFWYELGVIPIVNYKGTVAGGAIILHDITSIVQIDTAKTEFVSLASHQLRTPLAAIRWYTEMLLSKGNDNLTSDQREFVEVILTSNKRMINLVNSLLNVSRLELGTFAVDPKNADLIEVTESALEELIPYAEEKKITLEKNYQENLDKLPLDIGLMSIIVQNLVSNAIKYSPEGNKVYLSVSREDARYIIRVKDSGYGIPIEQQQQIFTKLFRADNVKTKHTEGTGLGLYIVKSILDTVGGKISFKSKEGEGTEFVVELPVSGMKSREGIKPLEKYRVY